MQAPDSTLEKQTQVKVDSLTVEELKVLIRETMTETFRALLIENDLIDPDAGKTLKPEVVQGLRESLQRTQNGERGRPLSEVVRELGIDINEL